MADGFTAVLIVAVVFSFVSFSVYMKYKTERLKHGLEHDKTMLAKENGVLTSRVTKLEVRIQVLESIVTGKEFKLREEIDALN
ncbi:MAG: hypothetical protein ACI95C_002704 [Pseudohongiellaceae bacterium]|jgi:hypothetical protein